jgi:GNAT superfamily N-acetyltransferase
VRIYQPNQVRPDAPQNQELEKLVREVVSHSDKEDLHMRFFGIPDVEAIPARITGRRLDPYEPPRDLVIVAFNKEQPVGYTDIAQDPPGEQTVEIALLVRTDMQRQGIGEAMFQTALEETRKKGIRHLIGYLHPENYKMKQALTKWSEKLHVHVRKEWGAGGLLYVVDL